MKQSRKAEKLKDSWYRCCEKGIDKKLEGFLKCVTRDELKERKRESSDLIKVFIEEVKEITEKYADNRPYIFFLTDSEGVLIAKYCCKENEENIKEGVCFTEDSCGTNAISLAMEVKNIIYLKGVEHYCDCFYNWECLATPIVVHNKTIGYLDMSFLGKKIIERDRMLFELILNKLIARMTLNVLFYSEKKIVLNEITKDVLRLSACG